jgi:hypothetical protein
MLEVTNTELGVSFSNTFDLSEDPDDDNYDVTKTFTFIVPDDVAPGIYPISSKVTFDEGDETESDIVELTVTQCEILVEEEEEEEEEVVVVQPPVTDTTPTNVVTAGTVTAPTLPVTEEKSLFQSSGFLIALLAGEVILVIVAILIVVAVVRKKGE